MAKAFLGLGSNLGDTNKNINDALKIISDNDNTKIINISSFYETEPVGYKDQDWFLNAVVEIDTLLEPYELLALCHFVEKTLKRKRLIRWGPRTIDVDILIYENYVSNDERLTIPHPRMTVRAFVMIPLIEIAPDIKINNQHIKYIVERLEGEEIRKIDR